MTCTLAGKTVVVDVGTEALRQWHFFGCQANYTARMVQSSPCGAKFWVVMFEARSIR